MVFRIEKTFKKERRSYCNCLRIVFNSVSLKKECFWKTIEKSDSKIEMLDKPLANLWWHLPLEHYENLKKQLHLILLTLATPFLMDTYLLIFEKDN
jgi:hypothetical protein